VAVQSSPASKTATTIGNVGGRVVMVESKKKGAPVSWPRRNGRIFRQPPGKVIQAAAHYIIAGKFLRGLGRWHLERIEFIPQHLRSIRSKNP